MKKYLIALAAYLSGLLFLMAVPLSLVACVVIMMIEDKGIFPVLGMTIVMYAYIFTCVYLIRCVSGSDAHMARIKELMP